MTDNRLNIHLSDQEREAALRLIDAGYEFFSSTQSLAAQTRVAREMPRSAFLFMATLLGTGTASAYDVYKNVREQNDRAGRDRLHLPVNAAYRAATWLTKLSYIEVADIVDEATDRIRKTVYRLTDVGAKALKGRGVAPGSISSRLDFAWRSEGSRSIHAAASSVT